ncbi:hypothetical protein GQ600_17561 [Phytophthora cactorum]|nr:hypothetical protein GQ600_17561 [Phytophthora cactorum]
MLVVIPSGSVTAVLTFAHNALLTIYPLFQVLYGYIPAKYQGFAMLLLPLWKIGAKTFVVRSTREVEDLLPQIVLLFGFFQCSVVSVCMYSSGSVVVTLLVSDILQSILEYREVRQSPYCQQFCKHTNDETNSNSALTSVILAIVRDPMAHTIVSLPEVRLWACIPHLTTVEQIKTSKELEALNL